MIRENRIDVGEMHVDIFLQSELVPQSVIIPQQVHGTNIVNIDSGDEIVTKCDALMTKNRKIPLGIKTADCAAVCFCDGDKIGIAHIGWRGLCIGLTEKMIGNFNEKRLSVYVAPFLHSFEIQKDSCYEHIFNKFGDDFLEEDNGKLIFNFKDALCSLLPKDAVYDVRNTGTDITLPSNRRDGTTNRFVIAVNFR